MNLEDWTARVQRLDRLARGLAKEETLWKPCNDPLLFLERKEYLKAVRTALACVDEARIALVRVVRRNSQQGLRSRLGRVQMTAAIIGADTVLLAQRDLVWASRLRYA